MVPALFFVSEENWAGLIKLKFFFVEMACRDERRKKKDEISLCNELHLSSMGMAEKGFRYTV